MVFFVCLVFGFLVVVSLFVSFQGWYFCLVGCLVVWFGVFFNIIKELGSLGKKICHL